MKKALITGVTGQDGAYLAELLLSKGYEVHGLKRRASLLNTARIDHLYEEPQQPGRRFFLHHGDLTDGAGLGRLLSEVRPDEIYNLGAQSHVLVSFEMPEYTADVDGLGVLRLLEAIRASGLARSTRFYQASSSELFGLVTESPQRESTRFHPRSPYGVAKLYGHFITVNYRESYGMFACNGILLNHESPLRGETFVTRKITRAVAQIHLGLAQTLHLGNLDAQRDWGHAKDYVDGMWRILQQPQPQDFVLATGQTRTVRQFAEAAFAEVGVKLRWQGVGRDECGYDAGSGLLRVAIDPRYFRPAEVDQLLGDPSLAQKQLDWRPQIGFAQLVAEMVAADIELFQRQEVLRRHGHPIRSQHE
jgi:GDPmannose 4,6-dehydratase